MTDEWGQDPSVRSMRRVFERMEATQRQVLEAAGVSLFDVRLRVWREEARNLLERGWTLAANRGFGLSEEEAGALYGLCLAETLRADGVKLPASILPQDEKLSKLVQEIHS